MLISTKGRYALRVMIDLAERQKDQYVPLKEIAGRQEISRKYLESIMCVLSKHGFIEALHGKGGGYRLNREPQDYKIREILYLTEGTLAPVSCLECETKPCPRAMECRTLPMWKELNGMIHDYLGSVTLADLIIQEKVNDVQ